MASRAPRVLLLAALQNFTWAALAMQRALAAIQAVDLACYASLRAPLMLFFALRRGPRVRRLCADFGSRSFRIILCDAPTTRTAYTSTNRVRQESTSCGALWQPMPESQFGNSRAWGKDLGCLCDLFQPHGTRTPRSWNCRCSARLPKAAHQSLPRPAALLDALDEARAVTALIETKTWSCRLPS